MPHIIVLLGPPGSGKGTQAKHLSSWLELPHISTGDLFRENLKENTEIGKRARSYIDNGLLVPDEVVFEMLFDRIAKEDCRKGYLLDGFPRTLKQGETLLTHVGEEKSTFKVLHLVVRDLILIERAAGRLLCEKCGHLHHIVFSPPKESGICDLCGGRLYQRSDDTQEVIQERLRVYHKQTEPLIQFFSNKNCLFSVDGEKTPEEVFQSLQRACSA